MSDRLITAEALGVDPSKFELQEIHTKMAGIWAIIDRLEAEKKEFLKGRNEQLRHLKKLHSGLVTCSQENNENHMVENYELDWRNIVDTAIANG